VSVEDLKSLDRYEGHPKYYKRKTVHVTDEFGAVYEVVTYVVRMKHPATLTTSTDYLSLLRGAAKEHNFPEEYQRLLSTFATLD
jgi:cation transport regulator ChaC